MLADSVRSARILVVDDVADNVELLRHLLVSAGYLSVECTTDPSTVCAAHRARPYDLILLDIMMPGVDGFEVMAGLRALEPEGCLCVIAVTANGDHKLRALQAGARDFIVKPIDPAEVLARVRNMLEMKILHDESRRHGERMESEVALRTARLKALSNRVLAVQEEERAHISRELHDDLGQSLTALKFGLHRLGGGASYEHPAILAECLATADAVLERVRQMSHDLRPPQLEQLGLEEALHWLVERHRAATGLNVRCHFHGMKGERLRGEVEGACYRIAQEALSNATRHARASSALLSVDRDESYVSLTVRDDGAGFDPSQARQRGLEGASLGLAGMEERAQLAGGRLRILSAPGEGTRITAFFPTAREGRAP